jgi:hypothetical protein
VAGHRLGTMEIESALVAHPRVAEAAVVGRQHEVKGESVFAYVVCRGARPSGEVSELVEELRQWVGKQLSPIAKPDEIRFTEALPKTRSGKIMRRLLRSIARGEEISQDVSTLENPAIVAQLRGEQAPARSTRAAPRASRARAPQRKRPAAKKSKRKRAAPKRAAAAAKGRSPKKRSRRRGARRTRS